MSAEETDRQSQVFEKERVSDVRAEKTATEETGSAGNERASG
jgi:hypothetical protein